MGDFAFVVLVVVLPIVRAPAVVPNVVPSSAVIVSVVVLVVVVRSAYAASSASSSASFEEDRATLRLAPWRTRVRGAMGSSLERPALVALVLLTTPAF